MLVSFCALSFACANGSVPATVRAGIPGDAPLTDRILDVRANRFIARDELMRRSIGSRLVILGETHDNAEHHRLQAEVFESMLRAGRSPALAMEQFDREHQSSLDSARARGERDAESLADAGRFDRKGWRWAGYKPLVELAAANDLPILAANLSRARARALMKTGRPADGLAPAEPALRSALERDMVEGHCGIRPSEPILAGMIEAQRGRDAAMAEALGFAGERGAVLVAGADHARRDRGVPSYLMAPGAREGLLSIAFVEVDPGSTEPQRDYAGLYDLVWFTPRAEREDPCKTLRLR